MVEIHKASYEDLEKLVEVWKQGIVSDAVQAQFGREGLEINNKRNGKTYHFVYNKIFDSCNWSKEANANKCFIWYTKSESKKANEAKFRLKRFEKSQDRYMVDGYPFQANQISILGNDLLEIDTLRTFMIDYAEVLISYKTEEEVWNTNSINAYVTNAYTDGTSAHSTDELTNKTNEGTIMSKVTEIASKTVDVNKEAILLAAKLEVGKVATAQLKKVVRPKLPMLMRGYADSPLFDIVLANAVGVALREYASENEKAQIVSEAMIQSAAVEMMSSFDLNGMIDDMLESVDVSKLIKLDTADKKDKKKA